MKKSRRMVTRLFSWLLVLTLVCTGVPISVNAAKKPKLNKTSVKLKVGKTVKLKLKNNKKKVKWSSANKKIATVNKAGLVKARKKGKTRIIARIKKKKYICKVTVQPKNTSDSVEDNDSDDSDGNNHDSSGSETQVTQTPSNEMAKPGESPDKTPSAQKTAAPGESSKPHPGPQITTEPGTSTEPGGTTPLPWGTTKPETTTEPGGTTPLPGGTAEPGTTIVPGGTTLLPWETAEPGTTTVPGGTTPLPWETAEPEKTTSPWNTSSPWMTSEPQVTQTPTKEPTAKPTVFPTKTPTPAPVKTPTPAPVKTPTPAPVKTPTPAPVKTPTPVPTKTPSPSPTITPTPTATPSQGGDMPSGATIFKMGSKELAIGMTEAAAKSVLGSSVRLGKSPQGYDYLAYYDQSNGEYLLIYLKAGKVVGICGIGSGMQYGSLVRAGDTETTLGGKDFSRLNDYDLKYEKKSLGAGAYSATDSSGATVIAFIDADVSKDVYCIQVFKDSSKSIKAMIYADANQAGSYSNDVVSDIKAELIYMLKAYIKYYNCKIKENSILAASEQEYVNGKSDTANTVSGRDYITQLADLNKRKIDPCHHGEAGIYNSADAISAMNSLIEQQGVSAALRNKATLSDGCKYSHFGIGVAYKGSLLITLGYCCDSLEMYD